MAGVPFTLRVISEFDLIHLARTGQHALVQQLLADASRHGRNAVRVFTRCWNLFDLNGDQPGYWEAADFVVAECERWAIYCSPVLVLDRYREDSTGHYVQLMSDDDTRRWVEAWLGRYAGRPSLVWSLVNEPEQVWQGYSGPTDQRLLELAELMAQRLGHRDFIIGAAADGDNPDASAETIELSRKVAEHCNFIVLHNSRMGGTDPEPGEDGRLRRWIDHLEGFTEIIDECRKVNGRAHGYHEEATGHASVQNPPGYHNREYVADCAIAAAMTAEFCELSYCYHRVRQQDAGTPGLDVIARLSAQIPAGWEYRNDSWGGSATHGFTWQGGKVRSYIEPGGPHGFVVAYGQTKGSITWANGYQPVETLHDGPQAAVYRVKQV